MRPQNARQWRCKGYCHRTDGNEESFAAGMRDRKSQNSCNRSSLSGRSLSAPTHPPDSAIQK